MRLTGPPTTIAVISMAGCAAGTGAIIIIDDLPDAGALAPLGCLTGIAIAALCHFSRTYARHARDLTQTTTRHQLDRQRELDQRERDLADREAAINRKLAVIDLRSVDARVSRLAADLRTERTAHAELQRDYEDLARDYNDLVRQELSRGVGHRQTTPQAAAVGYGPDPMHEHGPRRQQRRGPFPFLKVVETRDRQESS